MSFISLQFLGFFVVVTSLYFALPHAYRWGLLLLASCIFYMAYIPYYILILFLVIFIDYFAGIMIEEGSPRRRKFYLILSIISTCSIFFVFKYFDFFAVNIDALASALDWNYSVAALGLILPLGLSFHTFQSLSYIFEVYKGKQKAERHIGIYALYVMFYPQLVAGPIERPQHLLHQFREEHAFDYERFSEGLRRMVLGFFKKVVIADNLAGYVKETFANPHQFQGVALLVGAVFFAIEIYCDFSGYSDIAIGAARVMGFKLIENFKNPYFAISIQDFWHRWHISLSTWFRDYLYIPLGGNRVKPLRWCINIIVTFSIAGLWHGANWTYVMWGLLHGFFYIFSKATKDVRAYLSLFLPSMDTFFGRSLRRIGIFSVVLIAWIFFRASTFADGLYISRTAIVGTFHYIVSTVQGLFGSAGFSFNALMQPILEPLLPTKHGIHFFELQVFAVLALLTIEIIDHRHGFLKWVHAKPVYVRWSIYAVMVLSVMNLGNTNEIPFIYFKF